MVPMVRSHDPQAYWLLCALVRTLESSQEPSAGELELVHLKEVADKRRAAANSGAEDGLWKTLFHGGASSMEETEAMWEALCVEGQGLGQGQGPGQGQGRGTKSAVTASDIAHQQHRLFTLATEEESKEEEAAAAKLLDHQYYGVLKQLGLLGTSTVSADATGVWLSLTSWVVLLLMFDFWLISHQLFYMLTLAPTADVSNRCKEVF